MKILIVGLGSIARKHIQAARLCDSQIEFYALRHISNAMPVDGVTNVYSMEQVKSISPDFIIISNPTSAHKTTIEEMLTLNTPLFVEKPISDSLNMGSIIKQIQEQEILTYVGCNLRFMESLQYVKNNIGSKLPNEVNVYCGSYLPEWRKNVDWRTVYSANKSMGGGVHIDLIHEIDYLYWIFGAPDKVKKTLRNCSSLKIDACDYANYCLEYPTFAASVVLNYFRRDYKRTFELVFDDSTWLVDLAQNMVSRDGKIILHSQQQECPDIYVAQMSYFIDLVKNKKRSSINTLEQANEILKICL